ncbi:SapC family protein [Massilia sp. 9096]|uniref:SapC family protein n=1 Tax=Massilia sp. 9096 TaxID=1500894 RepID=UPI000690CD5D|nr:SapC family protein [Massilia sp. 9096]
MPNHAILNNVQHKHLRVITERGPQWGDALMSALTFPAEFRDLQACYPIVFAQNDAGGYDALALFGFEQGENLFLGPHGWDAPVIPLTVQRQPFMIGRGDGEELSVHIDMDSPRIRDGAQHGELEGEALFLSYGGTSEYLEHAVSMLRTIHDGVQAARSFTTALQELELLEPFVFDVQLDTGAHHRLAGFHAINEDRLAALSADQLAGLHRAGWLQPVYMSVASLSQFRELVARKNRSQAADPFAILEGAAGA